MGIKPIKRVPRKKNPIKKVNFLGNCISATFGHKESHDMPWGLYATFAILPEKNTVHMRPPISLLESDIKASLAPFLNPSPGSPLPSPLPPREGQDEAFPSPPRPPPRSLQSGRCADSGRDHRLAGGTLGLLVFQRNFFVPNAHTYVNMRMAF